MSKSYARLVRQGWQVRFPGEPSAYALRGKKIPRGCIELFGYRKGALHFMLVRVSPSTIRRLRRIVVELNELKDRALTP